MDGHWVEQTTGRGFSGEEKCLLELLRMSLCPGSRAGEIQWEAVNRKQVWHLAGQHKVLPLLYEVLEKYQMEEEERQFIENTARKTVQQSYRLLFLSRYLQELLGKEGVLSILLKGVGTAELYPVPELRKSGDIDLLIPRTKDLERACQILQVAGYRVKHEQYAQHQVVCTSGEGIEVELHVMLAEPFDNIRINRYLKEKLAACEKECETKEIMGVPLTILKPGFHAYQLLLHMLQHFLRAGFGLKLLCDWVVLWNQGMSSEEVEKFLRLTEESGLKGFCDMVTAVCVEYLGLDRGKVVWADRLPLETTEEFMQEILEAEEFGKSSSSRMVAMRGCSVGDYIREFHHQMCLNFPRLSRIFLLWGILWGITLVRFVGNNKRLRRVSSIAILRKAGERSRLIEKMNLFQRK